MPVATTDPVTLLVNGMRYAGWKEISIERGVDRCVSSFNLSVSERWSSTAQSGQVGAGQAGGKAWQIQPFDACTVFIGNDLVLTGHVESYMPAFEARSHGVRVAGHSLTKDLVDCDIDPPSGQFSGYSVAAIARAVCKLYDINVVVQTDLANQVVSNTNLQRCETAFSFLERLGRLAGVLLCDDENGNLVLTTAGGTRAASTLVQGQNIMAANATISVAKRFSQYVVKGQAGIGAGSTDIWGGASGIGTSGNAPTGAVQTQMRASATDTGVPRYRLHVTLAESQLSLAQMQARANWQRQFAYGQATKASVKVQGFRQADGSLWQINQIVAVTAPWLEIDDDLLVAKVKFVLDATSNGHVTELELGPVAGYTPDPGEVKLKKTKHAGKGRGGGINWSGAGGD
ncbi:phage baseplate assembly protein [Rhodopila sp.]|uniref:phage baseplate assembly protein n=1 Tax=Rhodopila sp. TaxID=2480087 RepID=UPI003D0E8D2C